ncbi:MAG: hypothetical protein H7831_18005 [Magnetococcus sp. WYHC-3]
MSVAFTWDIPKAEFLVRQWEVVAPVKIGGPAFNQSGSNFVSGRYIKQGYTITSRGCPNHCWFCSVWKREPHLIELPIVDGWNVLDDNLLACSENHIRSVFSMLKRQKQKAEFTGGLEARILKTWHIDLLMNLKPKQMFFAYDTPDDYDPLVEASRMLLDAGFTKASHVLRCYVLVGYPEDTKDKADLRLRRCFELGFLPMAMLWRNEKTGKRDSSWLSFQKFWARPAYTAKRVLA